MHGGGLTGEGRLLKLEIGGVDQAPVGCYDVAGLQQHNVTRYQFSSNRFQDMAVASYSHMWHCQLFQRSDCFFSAGFLGIAKHRVEHHDRHNDDRVSILLEQE